MRVFLFAALLLTACRNERPPAPTPEQNQQLNEADAMLNDMAKNEEGPEQSPGPSNTTH